MKIIFPILPLILFFTAGYTQTVEEIKSDRQIYIWGEGNGATLKKADQEALAMLISLVSAQVESRFELLKQENDQGYSEKFNSVINTYSNATLKNTERIVISNEPDAKVFRYIRRAELDKIFADRKAKIIEYAKNGHEAVSRLQIADALRYYYWSLTLLRSHPDGNSVKLEMEGNSNSVLLATWLPKQINNLFAGISITMGKPLLENNFVTILLSIYYEGKTVQNLDYSYWDGRDWSNIFSAKDGKGYIEFSGIQTEIPELKLKIEYAFEGEAAIDNELRDVMQKIDIVPFRNSYINIKAGNNQNIGQNQPQQQGMANSSVNQVDSLFSISTFTKEDEITEVVDKEQYLQTMQKLEKAIYKKEYVSIQGLFTIEGYKICEKLLQYGQACILSNPELKFIQYRGGVVCRSLPMSFKFKNNDRQFVEDVVFYFNSDKKIENLTFGLGQTALQNILGKNVWDEKVRLELVNFLENYKTAYALKRTDYIENLFADNALIIVGSVLKVKPNSENKFLDNQIVKYNRYSKDEYIKKLKISFAGNEYINIKFEDSNIRRSGKNGQIYGIQIKQDYFSSNYGDIGYLFLLVDLQDPDQPVIHVRTWQPKKNEDGSIYGVGDF